MTIASTASRVDVLGNGAATIFSFLPVVIFKPSDLTVTIRDALGVETVIAPGAGAANYALNLTTFPGTGSITYPAAGGTPLPTGSTLVMKRIVPLLQSVALTNQGAYLAQVQETEFDYLTAVAQQLQEQINRAVQGAATDTGGLMLPSAPVRAGKVLGFDVTGGPVALSLAPQGSVSKPYVGGSTAVAASQGNTNSILTAFNGDLTHVYEAISWTTTGNAFGSPTVGYRFNPEMAVNYSVLFNTSGHNESLAGNGGRTMGTRDFIVVGQYGQGDFGARMVVGVAASTLPGSTTFLANPAVFRDASQFTAGADGVYMQASEDDHTDNGFDVAAIHTVYNASRTNDTGLKDTMWVGYRVNSLGSQAIDAAIQVMGKVKTGIDLSLMVSANKVALALPADYRIHFSATNASPSGNSRATNAGTTYQTYDSASAKVVTIVSGVSSLQVGAASVGVFGRVFTSLAGTASYANDAAAAAGGVIVGELYRNGSTLNVRVT